MSVRVAGCPSSAASIASSDAGGGAIVRKAKKASAPRVSSRPMASSVGAVRERRRDGIAGSGVPGVSGGAKDEAAAESARDTGAISR